MVKRKTTLISFTCIAETNFQSYPQNHTFISQQVSWIIISYSFLPINVSNLKNFLKIRQM
jgi:hypothetical protein